MNIKKRLIISNTVTVVIPFIITIITAFTYIFISSKVLNNHTNYNNFKELAIINAEASKQSPEVIEDSHFQEYLSEKVSALNGIIIITKNNTIIFSSKTINKIDLEKCLEEIETKSLNKKVTLNDTSYIIESSEFRFKDGSFSNIILLAPSENNEGFLEKFIVTIVIVFIISLTAVNIFMSCLFSKRILKPVSLLKSAAAEISNGNLQYEIIEDGDDEIKELCHSFEVMRIQLKDSVNLRMKYDDNRKILISSISHDLKTPITSIKGYVDGILDGVANTPEKIESYLKTIYSKAEHIDVMIDDLLLYSKLDLNQIPFNFEKTDITDFFDFCIFEIMPELSKANIKIDLKNDLTHSKYVMIDRERMRRVITNILDNCRKYMDKKDGQITINLRETNSSIIIDIRDNGAGINKNDINKIFDRFYRADASRSGATGSGLGLAIAKQIVEGHKGKIWAVSYENEGTSIIISLAKINVQ